MNIEKEGEIFRKKEENNTQKDGEILKKKKNIQKEENPRLKRSYFEFVHHINLQKITSIFMNKSI